MFNRLDIRTKGLIFLLKLILDDTFFETLAMWVSYVRVSYTIYGRSRTSYVFNNQMKCAKVMLFFSHRFEISCLILRLRH